LLLLLVVRRGRVVERDELIRELWPDTVVEEANVTFQVSTLRKALGEDGSKWIETVPKPPDGSQVAFSWEGSREDNVDIYYLKLVGPGEPHRLTTDPAADFSPAWSPDGRQIAFLRWLAAGESDRCGIYLIPALGGAERRLAGIDLTDFRTAAALLAWTPDGQWLAAAGRFGPGPSEIWLLSPETGERRRLSVAGEGQIGDFGLSFSPDGRFLALLRFATRSVGDVYLLPLGAGYTAGGPVVRLTHENRLVGGPGWNSRGNRIFYSSGGALGYRTMRMLAIDPAHPERRVEPVPLPAGENATTLASACDRLVYYLLALRGAPRVASIEFFDLATRKTTLLHALDRPFWFGFALAPDERSILFSKIDSHKSDLMLVENLR
jgi:Tol biopolymer transport system component